MAGFKWDDKAERDLLMAIRLVESQYNAVTMQSWKKIAQVMNMMGYENATWTSVSQRWTKVTQKNFQKEYPQALDIASGPTTAGAAAPAAIAGPSTFATPAATPGPARQARQNARTPKREREEDEGAEEDQDEGEDEALAKTASVTKKASGAKKQKKN